jgi:exodeoxyribonuclease-3
MALHRKFDAILRLQPDIAVICECAEPTRLQALAKSLNFGADTVWIGHNRNKGLAVFAFNGYAVHLAEPLHSTLRHVAPVRISGPVACNLLAVWAQNGSGGVSRKHQLGPLRRALTKYRGFLAERPSIVAGDFNNNVYWHRPGWRINHANAVATLETLGLASVYHPIRGELQGEESVPPSIGGTARRWSYLSHRLRLPAGGMAPLCPRAGRRQLRGLVRHGSQRSCADRGRHQRLACSRTRASQEPLDSDVPGADVGLSGIPQRA